MKHTYLICFFSAIALVSCKKDFLEKKPQTEITQEEFFKSPADLETYTNGFYSYLQPMYNYDNILSRQNDIFSDDISIYTGGNEKDVLIRGGLTPATVDGWDNWSQLRSINFLLQNVSQTTGDPAAINNYIGVAKFFRANFYYKMVKRYGDIPWYSAVIDADDEELLTKPKDPRTLVVDSIMTDLEFAVANITNESDNTRITKWAALQLLARIALHEGTFRKYHEELNLQSTADAFLQKAASATDEIMTEGGFSIYSTGGGALDFRTLFSSLDLSANPEVIFLSKSSQSEGVFNGAHYVLDWQWAFSNSLEQDFLMDDGTPFTSQPGHDEKTFLEVFQNRDPRLAETIMPPGFTPNPPDGNPYFIRPAFGGYLQVKFYPRDPAQRGGNDQDYSDQAIFRYGETLLINAEAKAELGTIAQADIDNTINLLRARVNMPSLAMAAANAAPDLLQASKYPLVSGANKGLILEIRRERRVETAGEGLRYDDLIRWKAGSLLTEDPKGIYIPALGGYDVTGDGVEDIAILEAEGEEDPIAGLPDDVRENITKYYLSENSFYLSNGDSGNIMFVKDREQTRSFIDPKYYYFPIPLEQTLLNSNLSQPDGW